MKILLVNQTFYPDVVATAQHLTDLAIALKDEQHAVTVLASQRGYSEPYPYYPAFEEYHGVKIIRVWPFMFGRKHKLIRAIDALCVNLSFFFKMIFLPRADVVVALTSPPLVSFFACCVAHLKKSKFIYWVMDMNPDEAIAMGWICEISWITKILKKIQSFIIKHSDRSVVLDEYMKARLMGSEDASVRWNDKHSNGLKRNPESDRIAVIPPWFDDEYLKAIRHDDNPFRVKHALQNSFVVMYSGNHSVCHPLDTVLEAARLLVKKNSIIFIFIGGGARVGDVSEFKKKHGLNNIIQMKYVPRSEIKFSLSAADLHLVVMGDNMAGIVHPCKVYGVLSLGRPFVYVGPTQSHIADLIRQGAVGYAVRHGEAEKLAEIIDRSQSTAVSELERVDIANRWISERFSAKVLIPKLIAEISGDSGVR